MWRLMVRVRGAHDPSTHWMGLQTILFCDSWDTYVDRLLIGMALLKLETMRHSEGGLGDPQSPPRVSDP